MSKAFNNLLVRAKMAGRYLLVSLLALSAFQTPEAEAQVQPGPRIQCTEFLRSYYVEAQKAQLWVCGKATPWTVPLLKTLPASGFTGVDSWAFLAGEATDLTAQCLNMIIKHTSFRRVDSLAMLCRKISRDEFQDLQWLIANNRLNGEKAFNIARTYSPTSYRSFLKIFEDIYDRSFCDFVSVPLNYCEI